MSLAQGWGEHLYSHSQLSPAFAKPCSPWKFRKASALKGPEGKTQLALKPRSASVSLLAQAAFRCPLGVMSQWGWLKTNIAYLKSLAPIHWDRKTDHYHEPSYLGKHFFVFDFTSIFDFNWTTSLGVTSSDNYTSAKNTQLHPFRY
jgi:hypothetical protein